MSRASMEARRKEMTEEMELTSGYNHTWTAPDGK